MAEYIPFITGEEVRTAALKAFGDSDIVRLSAHQSPTLRLPNTKVWLDPAIDGLDDWHRKKAHGHKKWSSYIQSLDQHEQIADPAVWVKPPSAPVARFVDAVMKACHAFNPHVQWITVPQLPLVHDSSRNKINLALADATGAWRAKNTAFRGRLILPLIFTHQDLVNKKTSRNPRVEQAQKCYTAACADGIWVVETDLDDDSGAGNMRDRVGGLIRLHEELNAAIASSIRIGGPYWGANLVLWSRGLIDYPAIGVGGGFQYMTAGGRASPPSPRVALAPLRRIAGLAGLPAWLDSAMAKITSTHPAYKDLHALRSQLSVLADARAGEAARCIVLQELVLNAGRHSATRGALALFQDFSSAYALGKNLPLLDKAEASRKPHAVAEPLMLNCL